VIQLCAVLMAWLVVEDKGMRGFIEEKVGLDEIQETIREQLRNVEEGDDLDDVERENAGVEKEIMEVLIDVLAGEKEEAEENGSR
jgi:hypothetical protein